MEIIPAILAFSEQEFRLKIDRVKHLGLPVQVDVTDGVFTVSKNWSPVDRVMEITGGYPFDAHLMVSDPEHSALVWMAAGARKVFFHIEATTSEELIYKAVLKEAERIGIALNPETPVSRITHVIDMFHSVLILGVNPGQSGQQLQKIAIEKVKAVKDIRPSIKVYFDGGVRLENATQIAEAGADGIVIGTALTDAPDPTEAYERFNAILSGY